MPAFYRWWVVVYLCVRLLTKSMTWNCTAHDMFTHIFVSFRLIWLFFCCCEWRRQMSVENGNRHENPFTRKAFHTVANWWRIVSDCSQCFLFNVTVKAHLTTTFQFLWQQKMSLLFSDAPVFSIQFRFQFCDKVERLFLSEHFNSFQPSPTRIITIFSCLRQMIAAFELNVSSMHKIMAEWQLLVLDRC